MPSARLRRNVFHLCGRGTLLRAIYLATLVWPMLTPSLRSSPWKRGAPHNGLAMLISRISRRISNGAVGRPQRRHDFQRQYNLKPARRQRITVSGFTIVNALMVFGANDKANKDQAIHDTEGQSLRLVPSLDVKLMTRIGISASNETPRPRQEDQYRPDHAVSFSHKTEALCNSASPASRIRFPRATATGFSGSTSRALCRCGNAGAGFGVSCCVVNMEDLARRGRWASP